MAARQKGLHGVRENADRESAVQLDRGTAAETVLERQLSLQIMRAGAKPEIREVGRGGTLVQQGQRGDELFLLLDGVLAVEVDGDRVAEIGPGAILGERAIIEGGVRTSTLRADTDVKVAVATANSIAPTALAEVSHGHRREER